LPQPTGHGVLPFAIVESPASQTVIVAGGTIGSLDADPEGCGGIALLAEVLADTEADALSDAEADALLMGEPGTLLDDAGSSVEGAALET
jgi:hypothetical protein